MFDNESHPFFASLLLIIKDPIRSSFVMETTTPQKHAFEESLSLVAWFSLLTMPESNCGAARNYEIRAGVKIG